jgi:hypothetical protein
MTVGAQVRRAVTVIGAAGLVLAVLAPAAWACSPAYLPELGDVLASEPGEVVRSGDWPVVVDGMVERRAIASAPMVPLVTSRRTVLVPVRRWGEPAGFDLPGPTLRGEWVPLVGAFAFCGTAPRPRLGDAELWAIDGADGRHTVIAGTVVFDPTIPGGVTEALAGELATRFGPPTELAVPATTIAAAWLQVLWPLVLVVGAVALVLRRRLGPTHRL